MSVMQTPRTPPSARWASFDGWDYNGMKERLQELLTKLNKSVLIRHAERIKGRSFTMSKPFSAGQYWICFEMMADDGALVIARVRLPRHPSTPPTVCEEDELYSIACEVSTMQFVQQRLSAVTVPRVYAYEGPGSQLAADAGAIYMLLEGFYGNNLQDVAFDMCSLPVATQEHIMTQWTMAQAEVATLAYPQIGSISSISETGEPVIGKLASANAEGLVKQGPFSSAVEYFAALGEAALVKAGPPTDDPKGDSMFFARLGAVVFINIVQHTALFEGGAPFPLNHMDLGTQNILVDDGFNFLAIIDWEFAQTAPCQVNHFPMPFPLLLPDEKIKNILENPDHIAHRNVSRQESARRMYVQKFREAEMKLQNEGRPAVESFADMLGTGASRIYACFIRLMGYPEDEDQVREMVRLAFGFNGRETDRYLKDMEEKPSHSAP